MVTDAQDPADNKYRAKWKDGPPIARIAQLVIAAMQGDEEAQRQLGWKEEA